MNAIHALSQLSYSPNSLFIIAIGILAVNIVLTWKSAFPYNPSKVRRAGVVKLVDALDSKSSLALLGGGSSPPSGTRATKRLAVWVNLFFLFDVKDVGQDFQAHF